MSRVNTGGRQVAAYIASVYATHPAVRAVLLGGSIARGWGDRYSDLEIGVFWQEPPADQDRKDALHAQTSCSRASTRVRTAPTTTR